MDDEKLLSLIDHASNDQLTRGHRGGLGTKKTKGGAVFRAFAADAPLAKRFKPGPVIGSELASSEGHREITVTWPDAKGRPKEEEKKKNEDESEDADDTKSVSSESSLSDGENEVIGKARRLLGEDDKQVTAATVLRNTRLAMLARERLREDLDRLTAHARTILEENDGKLPVDTLVRKMQRRFLKSGASEEGFVDLETRCHLCLTAFKTSSKSASVRLL